MRAIPRLISVISLCILAAPTVGQTRVASFTPQGTVKQVRQATARFSAQMVPFGDLRLSDPFTIDCAEKGKGRWIDGSNWSYDFERDLPHGGGALQLHLAPGTARRGLSKPLAGDARFVFSTGGATIVRSAPREGGQADEKQIFVLGLDAPAVDASVLANAWCQAGGVNERIGVDLVKGAEREQVLAAQKQFVERHLEAQRRVAGHMADRGGALQTHAARRQRGVAGLGPRHRRPERRGHQRRPEAALPHPSRLHRHVQLRPGGRHLQCIPFLPMRLSFSAPVAKRRRRQSRWPAPTARSGAPTSTRTRRSRTSCRRSASTVRCPSRPSSR
ncbi:hypothetical protein LP420_07165 [Massilia sp. B-10]|nr:hypothetical protein LP420_07165 [Massilia sp. B-10]